MHTILCIAGFGDNASMFDRLLDMPLAQEHQLIALNLPGFGARTLRGETTLQSLAAFVADKARDRGATVVVAHSVASIIASLAATIPGSPLTTILSLEGNLTADDAYFSGTAASYDDPGTFHSAFVTRVADMGRKAPIMKRYRSAIAKADPRALWQLGCDAHRFSGEHVPGDVLAAAGDVTYFYNPENCPAASLEWLAAHPMKRVVLENASHWASVDCPQLLSARIIEALPREPDEGRA